MKIILRKQYISYEPNEYEFCGEVTQEKIKSNFENFPWEEQIDLKDQLIGFHVPPAFNLEYKNKELTIRGYHNGQFSVQFNHTAILRWQFGANMFSQEEVFDLIDQFPILRPTQFKKILATKRTIEESLLSIIVITLFNKRKKIFSDYASRKRNQFKMTYNRLFYCFVFSLIWLLMPVCFEIYYGGNSSIGMFLIFQGICFLMALPAIIISINHYAYNGKLQIIFQKGENKFEVINVSHSLSFNKKDVGTIVEIDSNSSRAPWNLYSYSILKFKDGSEIWLSSILISSANLNKQFYYGKKEYKSQWIPLLKKTMALNK